MATKKILVAEDDKAFRLEIGKFLRSQGYEVICVSDGYQAVEFTLREDPDLLVLDVHMPAGDGFSVHERVQKHPELTVTPVIYMTHDPTHEIEEVARRDGALTLLHKPFDLDALLAAIHGAIGPAAEAA